MGRHLLAFLKVLLKFRGGGRLSCERGGDGRRKIWIQPLMETNLGVAQEIHSNTDREMRAIATLYYNPNSLSLTDNLIGRNIADTLRDTKIRNLHPQKRRRAPHPFHMGVPPSPPPHPEKGGGGVPVGSYEIETKVDTDMVYLLYIALLCCVHVSTEACLKQTCFK